jgi:hypothetical protein
MTDKTAPNVRVFSVRTRFQELAQRPGGVPRDMAIRQAEGQVKSLRTDFLPWVDQEVRDLVLAVRRIQTGQAGTPQFDEVYRRCSQLRDTSATMGFALVSFISGNLCKVLDTIANGAPYDAEVIDCHLDALSLAKQEAYRTLRPEQVPEMTAGLHRMLERASRSAFVDKAG